MHHGRNGWVIQGFDGEDLIAQGEGFFYFLGAHECKGLEGLIMTRREENAMARNRKLP